jgi:hypothetical protein
MARSAQRTGGPGFGQSRDVGLNCGELARQRAVRGIDPDTTCIRSTGRRHGDHIPAVVGMTSSSRSSAACTASRAEISRERTKPASSVAGNCHNWCIRKPVSSFCTDVGLRDEGHVVAIVARPAGDLHTAIGWGHPDDPRQRQVPSARATSVRVCGAMDSNSNASANIGFCKRHLPPRLTPPHLSIVFGISHPTAMRYADIAQ